MKIFALLLCLFFDVNLAAHQVSNFPVRILEKGGWSTKQVSSAPSLKATPKISCMMVTKGRVELAQRAISCFISQTYPNKELVILDDSHEHALQETVNNFSHPQIRYIALENKQKTLGELRNMAVDISSGEYVAQWDDDDLYAPNRLLVQMNILQQVHADACFFEREFFWWPEKQHVFISTRRLWENSLLCKKAIMPRYPAIRQGEDTWVTDELEKKHAMALIDAPSLYVYVVHGDNTFGEQHFIPHLKQATKLFPPFNQGMDWHELLRQLDQLASLEESR